MKRIKGNFFGRCESDFNAKKSAWKSVFLEVIATGVENGERFEWVKEDSCALLLTIFILTNVSQSDVIGVLVNDFLVERKISRFTIYVIVFL